MVGYVRLCMKDLEVCFENAIKQNSQYVAVKIQMKGFEGEEIIVNPRCNFEAKLDYYKKAYNDDLTLKANNDIKIVDFRHFNHIDCI